MIKFQRLSTNIMTFHSNILLKLLAQNVKIGFALYQIVMNNWLVMATTCHEATIPLNFDYIVHLQFDKWYDMTRNNVQNSVDLFLNFGKQFSGQQKEQLSNANIMFILALSY